MWRVMMDAWKTQGCIEEEYIDRGGEEMKRK
jgi:hypothetical protein